MGFGLPDDGLHSPNEKYRLENYYTGIMTIAHFFEQMGERVEVREFDAIKG
jgi:acetylornithine deacetylase/succinyl-diaminopimelate desuccinylase-like protein